MDNIKLIRLFISCPSDIKDELDSIKLIIEEINKTTGKQNKYSLEFINWKYDTYGDIGADGQDVINRQLDSQYDILIGIIWQKLGTPTKRDESGTVEEINRAISNSNKEQLIFFKTTTPETLNEIDAEELLRVRKFKEKLKEKGVLYKEFNTINDFELFFRINLPNLIQEKFLTKKENGLESVQKLGTEKYDDIKSLINEVEIQSERQLDFDVFDIAEKTSGYFDEMSSSLSSMTTNLQSLTLKLNSSTSELNKITHIKDNRLRLEKGKIITTKLAGELDEFNFKLSADIPIFSNNLLLGIDSYSKALLAAKYYAPETLETLQNGFLEFKISMEPAVENCANLLRIIITWPPINSRFNQAKRNTELVLKDLTREMLNGLILINEISK